MKKAVVIGAGIGGLASAVRLAVKGYRVEVFEANSYPGGKLTEIRKDGFRFDAGPSLFTMPELVDELFTLCRKDASEHFTYRRLENICHYFYEDGTSLVASAEPEKFAREAADKTGVDEARVLKHLNKSRFIYNATQELFLNSSLHKTSSYFRASSLDSLLKFPFIKTGTTMNKVNEQGLQNEKMVQLFNRYATYNGSNPYKAPGTLHIIPHLEYNKGAYFPEGGMQQITQAIYQLAKSQGVEFRFNSPVKRIRTENGKATGISLDNVNISADLVVCNMDVVPAYKHLMPQEKQPEKILSQERSSSAVIFYWGIKKEFRQLGLHNIFFAEDYRAEFSDLFKSKQIHHDPTVYINITSKENPSDAPEGMENWFVMVNAPHNDGQDWDKMIYQAKASIIKKLSRMLGADISSLIVTEDLLEPRTIESRTSSYQGALYGTSSNSKMAAFFRHPNFSKRIGRLYFCGGSVHPGGGIPLALSSAKIVDKLIK